MKTGFIGLGAVGGKLAGNLLNNIKVLDVYDLDESRVAEFVSRGATDGKSAAEIMQQNEVVITSLPNPAASESVLSEMLPHMGPGKIWIEMSTTDPEMIIEQSQRVAATGATAVEAPVSGGCHRAATGNISIFAGAERAAFETVLPLLTILGRNVLHTGEIGTASKLKVMTNYLATANLLTLCEALTTMKAAGLDLATTYEAIRISSGNSFVHETESQLILSGSRDVDFAMDLVLKDIGLFQQLAEAHDVPLELSPQIIAMMKDGQARYGERAQSDRMIERLEEAAGVSVLADGFPQELVDEEPPARGAEVVLKGG
ncbi:2-(hydroxymethyl)glutarate dehydrogenase [Pelagimonas phthalicica]|uniref:2-(Hydroxymethyl)glutarate dehydrogenase n=1 Tax=Pelagimonas phthalicica TaxID=1037362 RepID=A0A238JJ92_9RHOB|nr:NAD(P)-dependent oxidoreductase [Pelagimonas phthalicica]TDS90096.1 3-hydroxyisobutyrate dehydrogenase [Pelagimonas phthalicica]SMX30264.1 2-(hydroxymethyl)glutarate dehydrogenase [Pelagimonas phthalicica]